MDVRNQGWYGQLQISGIAKPINAEGSPLSILNGFITDLLQSTPRSLAEGKEIIIRISDRRIASTKTESSLTRVLEVEAGIDSVDEIKPNEYETYENFVTRLIHEEQLSESAALYIASDWFKVPPPPGLNEWLHDSKAVRFRQLNYSREAFDSAQPNEYNELKRYVLANFPDFCHQIQFRVA